MPRAIAKGSPNTVLMPAPPSDDESFEAAAEAQKAATRRALWILFGSIGLLFALLAYAFVADEAPPDVSDLVVPRLNPPEAENAYALLAKLALALPAETRDETDPDHAFSLILEGKVAWDSAALAPILARYPADLASQVETALLAPHNEAPDYEDVITYRVPEVGHLRRLVRILAAQASDAHRSGDHAGARRAHLAAFRLGESIERSRGLLLQVLSGANSQAAALHSITALTDSETISAEDLRAYLDALGEDADDLNTPLHIALKREHFLLSRSLDNRELMRGLGGFGDLHPAMLHVPGSLQPNRTRRWHAEITRATLTHRGPPPPRGTQSESQRLLYLVTDAPWPRRAENIAGRVLLSLAYSTPDSISVYLHRIAAQQALTRLYLALRLYHLENEGRLPATLDELVPGYLPAVPLDPFDGQTLRYDRALTTIWSTGPGRDTVRSAEGDFPRDMPAYRLRFARPPEPLPTFAEYQASQSSPPGLFGDPEGKTAPPDVSSPE
jgi:hypothetical protein